jgi:hypothetical protein
MQGDAVTVAAVDMGAHRGLLWRLGEMGGPYEEVQGHRECFTRGSGSVYECEVLLCTSFSRVGADSVP